MLTCWDCGFKSCRVLEVHLLQVLCIVRLTSLWRAGLLSRGVLPRCVVVCDLETSSMTRPWLVLGRSATKKILLYDTIHLSHH
jgi:hypothetical protein